MAVYMKNTDVVKCQIWFFLVKTLLIRVKEIWVTPLVRGLNYQDALDIMHYLDQQTRY